LGCTSNYISAVDDGEFPSTGLFFVIGQIIFVSEWKSSLLLSSDRTDVYLLYYYMQ